MDVFLIFILSDTPYESSFELNLNFQGHKNPSDAFKQIGNIFDKLIEIDRFVLYNILPTAKIEYDLINLEYGSFKTRIAQILKAIPDDILKDIASPKKLIGITLTGFRFLLSVKKVGIYVII